MTERDEPAVESSETAAVERTAASSRGAAAAQAERAVVRYRIRFEECAPDGALRAASYLRLAQDVAWIHSERLGYDHAWYDERGLMWFVRGIELSLYEPSTSGDVVSVSTEVVGFRRVWARRRTEVRATERGAEPGFGPGPHDGRLLGLVLTDWVMTDRRGPVRVPGEIVERLGAAAESFEPIRIANPPPPAEVESIALVARPQELDPLGHVNNAVYLDWLDEAILAAGLGAVLARVARRYRLEYLLPTPPGASLVAAAWPEETEIAGSVRDPAGGEHLRARVAGEP